ncbi:MAG: SLC13 family permease [Armatimonadetes bacterium]|nr:SLC13 family permease [Armatimonadota bacterium]
MTQDMQITAVILFVAVLLFVTEKISVDLVALLTVCALTISGILTPSEGFSGFGDAATVTVAAMFILGAGLSRTGAVNRLADFLTPIIKRNLWMGMAIMMLTISAVSGFINNTACVAVFMPIALSLSRIAQVSPSKLLMPTSFAAILGGTCTLIGTSPNIVVSSIAVQHGEPPFGMFEFSQLGLLTAVVGTVYMLFLGIPLIPARRPAGDLTGSFGMGEYLTDIVLLPDAPSVGKTLEQSPLIQDLDIDVLEIRRDGEILPVPGTHVVLRADDILRVRCDVEKLRKLQQKKGIRLTASGLTDKELRSGEAELVEAVVARGSLLDGETLAEANFRSRFGATAIAIRHRNQVLHEGLGRVPLRAGDALLIEVSRERLELLKQHPAFVLVNESGERWFRKDKALLALGIFAAVVLLSTLEIVPINVGAVAGSIAMILTGCMRIEDAYRALDLKVLFLIAGALSLGAAIEKTGAAVLLAKFLVAQLGTMGPTVMVGGIYLIAMLLTELISNSATAALVTPLAIATAHSLGVDPRPFLIAVTFAASASFMTPVGYQTNTMIYGPGQYKFMDFIKVGGPLNLLCWINAMIVIPILWPLYP